ncbi:hypothetical protein JNUCC0626_42760 [Lentzea sp. JNUCC 0626]|uniref:hypothetical protein n=1 Tax=Lentzea sp. JNUCC 0626 TaxID=3367513 RepID=UPI0037486051
MRKVFTVLGALAMMLAFVVAPAQATEFGAQAGSCSGSVTYQRSVGGVGQLKIFYSNGSNSACFYHIGAAAGKAAETYVEIYKCVETSGEGNPNCTYTSFDSDGPGNWKEYAGPVGVSGTANVCVAAFGYIVWGGAVHAVDSGRQGCPN